MSPYRWRMVWILLTGVGATSFGLAQPYISKLLIDEALLRRDFHALVMVSLMMVGATVGQLRAEHPLQLSVRARFGPGAVRYAGGAVPPSAVALAALLGAGQAGRRGLAHQQRYFRSAAHLGRQPAERALERGVPGGQRRHHGIAERRGCFCSAWPCCPSVSGRCATISGAWPARVEAGARAQRRYRQLPAGDAAGLSAWW